MGRWSGPGPYFPAADEWSPRRRLRAVKRIEAEERNTRTPYVRTAAYRREVGIERLAPLAEKPPKTKWRTKRTS